MAPAPLAYRTVAIVGGGCYGSFYARQLVTARERGAVTWDALLIVDRDPACRAAQELRADLGARLAVAEWETWFGSWLDALVAADDAAGHMLVPSPLMPHLLFGWLLARGRRRFGTAIDAVPVTESAGTPFEWLAPDGARYLSHADWRCPVHCIEPRTCPELRAPRTWDMADTLAGFAPRAGAAGLAVFACLHRTHGVGMIDLRDAADAARRLDALRPGNALLVATASACHGATGLLRRRA